jgi:hypothetical protein
MEFGDASPHSKLVRRDCVTAECREILFPMWCRFLIPLLLLLAPLLPAETTDTLTFRIAYLRREETGHASEQQLEDLRRSLLSDATVRRELTQSGYGTIGLFACDGAADMLRRLNGLEFDMAFTPANIYHEQAAGYSAFLKARRPRDIIAPPPSNYVRRLGIVFVSRRHPLFGSTDPTPEQIRAGLQRDRIAVVSTQSVAGFNAPLLALAKRFNVRQGEGGYLWFENSEEVAKAVLSGLADVGACEAGALETVLREAGLVPEKIEPMEFAAHRDRAVRILLETDPVVTDPVVVRRELAPRRSPLGRILQRHLIAWKPEGDSIQYREATDEEFKSLRELLREFNRVLGRVGP